MIVLNQNNLFNLVWLYFYKKNLVWLLAKKIGLIENKINQEQKSNPKLLFFLKIISKYRHVIIIYTEIYFFDNKY